MFDLYLARQSACDICDRVLTPAFHSIGERWECGEVSLYRERRACEIGLKLLHDLRVAMHSPPAEALTAIGGTLEWDPYRLPTAMIEIVLREIGWQATSLGTHLPATTLAEAVYDNRPRLLWVSVSCIESISAFLEEYALLYQAANEIGAAVVVGGRALTVEVRHQMTYSSYCDTFSHLATFVSTLTSSAVQHNSYDTSDVRRVKSVNNPNRDEKDD